MSFLYDCTDDRFKVLADLRRGTHLLKALGYQGWQRGALLATWEPLQKSSDKPSVFRSAAFLGTDGVTYETGSHHDIEALPAGVEVSAEGFVDRDGHFHTRDEAAKVMCLDHALHSEEVELKKGEGQKASNRDLRDAVEYVRVVHGHDVRRPVHVETAELEPADIVSNFMFGNHHLVHTKVDAKAGTIDGENPGWLRSYPPEDWAGELKRRHGREFSHIVEPYRMHGKISPAVMVGNNVGDGLGRAIFSHAVGAKLPVAIYDEAGDLKKAEPGEPIEWLHGTSGMALREAAKEGQLRPGNLNAKSRGWTIPMANHVYLTRSPEIAVKYANWKSGEHHGSPDAGIAVVRPDPGKLVPDEDWLGALALHGMAQHRTDGWYASMPPKHPLWPRLMTALQGHPVHKAIEGTSDYDADRSIHHARIGKRIIPVLKQRDPGLLKELTDIAPSVAHEGPLPIVSAHVAPLGGLDAKDWRASAQPLEVGVRKSEVEAINGEKSFSQAAKVVHLDHAAHSEEVLKKGEEDGPVIQMPLSQLHVERNSLDGALDDVSRGKISRTSGPLHVWQMENGHHVLIDGHHRLAESLLRGTHGGSVPVQVVGRGYTDYWATPHNPVKFTTHRFGGAEGLVDPKLLHRDLKTLESASQQLGLKKNEEKSFSQEADNFIGKKNGNNISQLNREDISSRLRGHRETLEAMATTSGQHPAFQVAAKVAGHPADAELRRQAELDYGDDLIAVALAAHGLNPDDESLRMSIEAACLAMRLQKSEFNVAVLPRMVTAGQMGAEHMVTTIRKAFASNLVYEVRLGGKHSAGTAVAYDQQADRFWLLKPGSARVSPAAGVDQTSYSQSRREAAFAQAVRVYEPMRQFYPETQLLLLDGHEVACMEVMGQGFRSAQRYGDAAELLKPYQDTLDIYRWAFWDWVLGNPDGHGGNLVVTEDGRVALIDHGSALAGPAFNPPMDRKSFIPYYLRVFRAIDYKKASPEQRYNGFPHPTPDERDVLKAWMQALGDSWAAPLEELTPGALAACQQRFDAIVNADDPADELLRRWAGLPAAKT